MVADNFKILGQVSKAEDRFESESVGESVTELSAASTHIFGCMPCKFYRVRDLEADQNGRCIWC